MSNEKRAKSSALTRRGFLKYSAGLAGGAVALPAVVPASVFGGTAPSNRIVVGFIGVGRMGQADLREVLGFETVQVIAVCDVDAKRLKNAQQQVESHYAQKTTTGDYKGCATYGDFRELLTRDDIDVVMICTPDHWHAIPAIEAARAGKDLFVQKPLTLTIAEGRALSDTVRRYGRVLQVGSQQRSDANFRQACELVRNKRIGKVHTVKVGLPPDTPTTDQPAMPVPEWLDYDMWLGPAPWAAYTEKRVHPQDSYDRPGWLCISDYGSGMITGWGSHHLDIIQWGLGTEHTGPVEIQGTGDYFKQGLWDVHGAFQIEYTYADGVKLMCTDDKKNKSGVLFEGTEGWVFVTRGQIDGQPESLLTATLNPDETKLYKSNNHKADFFDCVRSRAEPIAPVEVAHRSCSVCLLGEISMRLGRRLKWDPQTEQFVNDAQADRMLFRPMRSPWHL